MNILLSLMISLNLICSVHSDTINPPLIDAYILAYDAIYNMDTEPQKDFIILDMESNYFVDTSYEERQKVIDHFSKYNKHILNASLFKLKEIGLASKNGTIIVNGDLLTMTNVYGTDENTLIIEGTKYRSSLAAYSYRISLKNNNGHWKIENIESLGIA